jgi:OOP family OmpA-OmpF porin
MKAGKPFAVAVLLLLGALLAIPQAAAQGFYIGAGVGESDADAGNAVPDLITSGSFDGSGTGVKFFGGVQFNPHFGMEMAFVDLGEAAYSGTCCFGTPVTNGRLETSGFNFSFVGTAPFGQSFSLFGKVGFFSWESEARDVTGGRPFSRRVTGTDLSYGFGGSFHVTRNFSLRVEWEQFEAVDDVSLLSIGAAFRF